MTAVHIRGGGIAALCARHLLTQAGIPTVLEATERPRLPAILLSDSALQLIRDVFDMPDLFADFPVLTSRIVAWRRTEPPVELPHRAVVVSEEQLLRALQTEHIRVSEAPDWTLQTSRPQGVAELHFGTRRAQARTVQLIPQMQPHAFWIEALPDGWLFLIPKSDGTGWLLSVGQPHLQNSRLIGPLISAEMQAAGSFPAYPRILETLCQANWLGCGSAAIAFDPICGDGTANALREAILASAVLRAIHRGLPVEPLLRHYQMRLLSGFAKHLLLTRDFYLSGERGDWWLAELDGLQAGIAWCRSQLGSEPVYQFRLEGSDLYPLQS